MKSELLSVHGKKCSLIEIAKTEWRWCIAGGVFSFIFASILMSGWPSGIAPELSFSYIYQGDGLSHSWLAQRAIEGWIFDNPRSGYPFGSDFRDYPGSDSGNLLFLKLLGMLTGNYYSALNLYFLSGFFVIFGSAFCVLRFLGLARALAISAALLFTFLPFHFLRLGHLFYTWYFVVPIFFYLCFIVYQQTALCNFQDLKGWRVLLVILALMSLASFGVYYALFGVIMLTTSALAAFFKTGRFASFFLPLFLILALVVGVFANIAPSLINTYSNGTNPEVAVRSPGESEIYGLKLIQMLLPRADHRSEYFSSFSESYNSSSPIINENTTAVLGLIGAMGLIVVFFVLVATMSKKKVDSRLSFIALLVLVLLLFGTTGGFGALFSYVVSSSIRGWNRISVFIAFGAIATFFFVLQMFIYHYLASNRAKILAILVALFTGVIGLYDQTVPACTSCIKQTKMIFEQDKEFIAAIERALPRASAVYQLPYMPFPEVAPLNRLHTYDLSVGFLHSKELRWSYAGMKGRPGDLFYRSLAQEPIEKQLEVIRDLGFAGIYIDRRGFKDNADLLIEKLSSLLGSEPMLRREDGEIVFFRLDQPAPQNFDSLTAGEIMRKADYVVDKLGVRYPANLSDGIDFTLGKWPEFIKDVRGLSGSEPWGRWSDAKLSESVKFEFYTPLPTKFALRLIARPFGRDGRQQILIKIGKHEHHVTLESSRANIKVPISLDSNQVDTIELIPLEPVSPRDLNINSDNRKLGIGFVKMWFEE